MSESNIWDSVLAAVEKRINHESFKAFFKPTSFLGMEGSTLRVKVPDRVIENLILNNYRDFLEESLDEVGMTGYSIVFESPSDSEARLGETRRTVKPDFISPQPGPAKATAASSPQHFSTTAATSPKFADADLAETHLNPKYTFDTFVVGESNKFAHAAALSVADRPSSYNPLFIYGGVGLGKTHLMNAIGHRIKEKYPHLLVCYISAERFLNEMIAAIRYHQTIDFRKRYRSVDILMIDDIQFIADKQGTQEEFFHTFNELHEGQKQIVISADCAPKDIPTLEERLHSRFEWGLIADITPPNLETKVAILCKKAESENIDLPHDVAIYIAKKVKSNIRQLEGSLTRLAALASLRGDQINQSLAQEAIKHIVGEEEPSVTIEKIQKVVANYYKLKVSDLKSESQKEDVVLPRQVAMYLCRTLIKTPYKKIGKEFGDRDHSTVMSSVKKIQKLIDEKKDNFHMDINRLTTVCKET